MSKFKGLAYRALNFSLGLVGTFEIAAGIWFTLDGDADSAAKMLGVGLVFLFAANLDRFESLKAPWMEVKLRRTIGEAEELVKQLHGLSELTGRMLVRLTSRDGRLGQGATPRESYELAYEVKSLLETAGAQRQAIESAIRPWAHWALFDMTTRLNNEIRAELNEVLRVRMPSAARDDAERERLTKAVELRDSLDPAGLINAPLSAFPAAVRSSMAAAAFALEAAPMEALRRRVGPWLEEMEHLAMHLELRDPEGWFAQLRPAA